VYRASCFVDAYDKVAPPEYRRHERDREREEFERSGKFFKDLSGVMASRFTRSKLTEEDDDSKVRRADIHIVVGI